MTDILPEPTVSITRYEVSILPRDDINRRYFTLFVELTRGGWTVHDGHGAYDTDGDWAPGLAVAHEFADYDDALALAKKVATDAYRRKQAAPAA